MLQIGAAASLVGLLAMWFSAFLVGLGANPNDFLGLFYVGGILMMALPTAVVWSAYQLIHEASSP